MCEQRTSSSHSLPLDGAESRCFCHPGPHPAASLTLFACSLLGGGNSTDSTRRAQRRTTSSSSVPRPASDRPGGKTASQQPEPCVPSGPSSALWLPGALRSVLREDHSSRAAASTTL